MNVNLEHGKSRRITEWLDDNIATAPWEDCGGHIVLPDYGGHIVLGGYGGYIVLEEPTVAILCRGDTSN